MSYPSARIHAVSARTVLAPLLTAIMLSACVAFTAYVSLMTLTGQSLDDVALAQAKADRNIYFPQVVLAAAQNVPELISFAGAIVAIVWTVHTRRWIPALIGLVMIVGANVTTQFLKRVVLEKPDLGIQNLAHNSFPSGHTTATATILLALLLVAPPRLRAGAATWGWILAAGTGMLTVLNGWHRPSDAAAALLVVGVWGVLAALAVTLVDADRVRSGARPRARGYQQLGQYITERKNKWRARERHGESAYLPPADAQHRGPYPHSGDPDRRVPVHGGPVHAPAPYGRGWERQPDPGWEGHREGTFDNGPYCADSRWNHELPGYGVQYRHSGYAYRGPVRPGRGIVIALVLLTIGLSAAVVLLPWPAVAGTWAGRITVSAGYLGIAAAAALSWRSVSRALRWHP